MKGKSMLRFPTRTTLQRLLGTLVIVGVLAAPATPLLAAPLGQEAPALTLDPIGTFATGIFDEGASEIVAYDAGSMRLFSVNSAATTVDILDLTDPTNPTLLAEIDATEFGAGANSVAVYDGLVAVAIGAEAVDGDGSVVFMDVDGTYLADVTVGVLPDMVTFSPDGMRVLTANEGEPSDDYTIDPLGSVSIIDLSAGVDGLTQAAVTTLDFSAFNDAELDSSIRIFGPDATVAQDLEPEYVAVTPDSTTAYVTLQENNAVAVIDLVNLEIAGLVGLGTKNFNAPVASAELFPFENLPVLGTTEAGQEILMGGFSGLWFVGVNESTGALQFVTHPDRGPNPDPMDTDGDGVNERPFALPDYQARIIRFELDPSTGEITLTDETLLTRADGTPITGLPNLAGEPGMAYADELPIDLFGNPLELDPFGADMEGIAFAEDGTFWMVDEYRPAIYHFDADGLLIDRFVPEGSNASGVETGTEAFPAVYAQRRANRGFEAVALDNGILYAFIQSPIDNPDRSNDRNSRNGNMARILAFDTATATTVGDYLYPIGRAPVDKIGDAVALGNGEFLVIERDDAIGRDAQKFIYKISLEGATNLLDVDPMLTSGTSALERQSLHGLASQGIFPVQKALYVDLAAIGAAAGDKTEGLALIDENTLAILNDNDFGISPEFDPATGLLGERETPSATLLGLIYLRPNGMDASDEDGEINIQPWPVEAFYLPDAITAYVAGDGETYLITANEGDTRDYAGFSEETRIGSLVVDWSAVADSFTLQAPEALGRLLTSNVEGDTNGDGLVDLLTGIGGRSFSIWRTDGTLAWDSGDEFEQITAELLPEAFNSNGGADSFDTRSDAKGPEPEAVVTGVIGDRVYAFVALERTGGVMVYDVTDPIDAFFVTYANNHDITLPADDPAAGDVGPESVTFIPADASPNGENLIVVGNEVSGSITVYSIDVAE
jgi:hypothetical protein